MSTALEAFGVVVELAGPSDLVAAVQHELAYAFEPARGDATVEVTMRQRGATVEWELDGVSESSTAERAVHDVRGAVEHAVAERSPTHVFVHAGVVVHRGAAIVLPGSSHSGKSTAVVALVDAGARYYSDEYAVLDERGYVHALPRPVNVRHASGVRLERIVGGGPPVPVGTIALARYDEQERWRPSSVASGVAVLKVMEHTVVARIAPERAIDAIAACLHDATVLEGPRGGADEFARELLAQP